MLQANPLGCPYGGARVALLTKHAKEQLLAPLFAERLGASIDHVDDFDTDTLGTFTREIPRHGTQLDAARRKADIAIERSGAHLGLGSEGAFRLGPLGLYAVDVELIVLVDRRRGIEIVGTARTPAEQHVQCEVDSWAELASTARHAAFPANALTLRPGTCDHPSIVKGIRDWPTLRRAFDAAAALSGGRVFAESDVRAHMSRARRITIAAAARDLLDRMTSLCERCALPGFGPLRSLPGLPCRDCGTPTELPRADEHACVSCDHRVVRARAIRDVGPFDCPTCNP